MLGILTFEPLHNPRCRWLLLRRSRHFWSHSRRTTWAPKVGSRPATVARLMGLFRGAGNRVETRETEHFAALSPFWASSGHRSSCFALCFWVGLQSGDNGDASACAESELPAVSLDTVLSRAT